jgi:hypothetical protein
MHSECPKQQIAMAAVLKIDCDIYGYCAREVESVKKSINQCNAI